VRVSLYYFHTIFEIAKQDLHSPHTQFVLRVDTDDRYERCEEGVDQVGRRISRQLIPLLSQFEEQILHIFSELILRSSVFFLPAIPQTQRLPLSS